MTTRSETGRRDLLAAFGSIPDWLAAPMTPGRIDDSLRTHGPDLAAGRLVLETCSPDRLRAKEGGEWLARYTAHMTAPDGARHAVVLTGRLWPPGIDPHPLPANDGTSFGEPGWVCWLPDLRLELRVQAADDALPALPGLVDPGSAAQFLQPVLREAGHPTATIGACSPHVVRYKPGSRCTIVVDVAYLQPSSADQPPSPVVIKTHQGEEKGARAWAAMNALWERPWAWRDVVRLAEPLAYLPQERILVQGPVPETSTLKEVARQAIGSADPKQLAQLREELGRTAAALAAIHRSGASLPSAMTFEDELADVIEILDRLTLSVPGLADAAAPLVSALVSRSLERRPGPMVPAHHDFRPAQVLLHDGGVGFIDFDGACMAEPALDVGRFRAKLRDIGISATTVPTTSGATLTTDQTLALLDELCEHFLEAYQQHAPVSRERVLLWEACDLLTTMLHAWTKVRLARLEPRLTTLVHQVRSSGLIATTRR